MRQVWAERAGPRGGAGRGGLDVVWKEPKHAHPAFTVTMEVEQLGEQGRVSPKRVEK